MSKLPPETQKALYQAGQVHVCKTWGEESALHQRVGSEIDFYAGAEWLYSHFIADQVEFDESAIRKMVEVKATFIGWPDQFLEGARWQHFQSQATVAALKSELEEANKAREAFRSAYWNAVGSINELRKRLGEDPGDY